MTGILPTFIVDWIANRGFWWVILANLIVGMGLSIIWLILGKINKLLGAIIYYVPITLFAFYIAQVRTPVGWLIVAIIAAIISVIMIVNMIANGGRTISVQRLQNEANQMNANFPTMVEDGLRLDSASVGFGLKSIYSYTLTNIVAGDPNIPAINAALSQNLLNNINNTEQVRPYRESGVVFSYVYNDRNGNHLFTCEFGPRQYRGYKRPSVILPLIFAAIILGAGAYVHKTDLFNQSGGTITIGKQVTATVNATVNFRDKPSTDSTVLKKVEKGEKITIIGESQNGWVPIRHGKDKGWISEEFVKKGGE